MESSLKIWGHNMTFSRSILKPKGAWLSDGTDPVPPKKQQTDLEMGSILSEQKQPHVYITQFERQR